MSFVVHRVAKSAARYTDAGGREKCGYCRFFVAPRACGKVIGPVSPQGWCKYFSRQVAQQYSGAGITGGGGPPGVTLDLNFMSSGNMPPGITFTRTSTATYTDASGVIQTAAVNQPRWDYAGGSLRGLLIEEARTNMLLASGDMFSAGWNQYSSLAAIGATPNNIISPDGTLTGLRLVYPAVTGAGNTVIWYQQITLTAAPYTFSVWMKGNAGGEQIYLCFTPRVSALRITLTTQWQRFSVTFTGTAALWTIQIGADLADGAQTSTPAQTVYAWGAQVEPGAFAPTSYIPTLAASVTRAQDVCYISSIGSAPWFNAAQGTLSLEYDAANPGGIQGGFSDGSTANLIYFSQNGGANCFVASVSKSVATSPVFAFPATNKIAASYQPNRFSAVINGGAVATDVTIPAGPFLWTSRLTFGCSPWGLDTQIGGHMRRATFWPRALSNAEMQQVTT